MANKEELYHEALDKLEQLKERIINSEVDVESISELDSNFGAKGLEIRYRYIKKDHK